MPAKPKKQKPFGWVCERCDAFHVFFTYKEKSEIRRFHGSHMESVIPLYKQEPKR